MLHCKSLVVAVSALAAVCVGTSAAASGDTAKKQTSAVQADVDSLVAAGAVSALSQVVHQGSINDFRAGVVQRGTTTPVPFDGRHRIGSITKPFVATVMLQLVDEGRVGIDAPLRQYLPNVVVGNGYDDSRITIRNLMQHTSGVFNYTDDNSFARMYTDETTFNSRKSQHYEPTDLINIALGHKPYFAPGGGYRYSNTDYIILGEVIKAVTGNTWDTEVTNRIITPLGLVGTSYPGDTMTLPAPSINGYNIFTSVVSRRAYTDVTQDNLTWAGAAGGLISTTGDETKFMSALLGGQLLAPNMLAIMKTTTPFSPTSGLGIGSGSVSCSDGSTRPYWGVSGKVVGYDDALAASPTGAHSVVLTRSTTSFNEQQFNNDNSTVTNRWVSDAFCGWPAA